MGYLNRHPRLERRSLFSPDVEIREWKSGQYRGWLETRNGITSLRLCSLSMQVLARENLKRIRGAA